MTLEGNDLGSWPLVHIVEVSVIGGVCSQRFHCIPTTIPAMLSCSSHMLIGSCVYRDNDVASLNHSDQRTILLLLCHKPND